MRALLTILMVSSAFMLATSLAFSADFKPLAVSQKDKCPVCGMFVYKYPDFATQVLFRDGSTFHFDGAKDMFKFYQDVPRYAPGKNAADIIAVFVTNYYTLAMVDGLAAFYVVGSDVYGPMGLELIPFAKESEAGIFMEDHKGKQILRFGDVSPAVIQSLD